jgi:hypothetical protein
MVKNNLHFMRYDINNQNTLKGGDVKMAKKKGGSEPVKGEKKGGKKGGKGGKKK